jgi:hypothetical protein
MEFQAKTGTYRVLSLVFATAISLMVLPQVSSATTIFTNFGTGQSFDAINGWTTSGPSSGVGSFEPAMAFTPTGNFDLTQIDVALSLARGTDSVILSLNSDAGNAPGTVIQSWTLSNLPTFGSEYTPETVLGAGEPLSAGQQYWLVAAPGASDSWAGWNQNSTSDIGTVPDSRDQGLTWNAVDRQPRGAFDVLGTSHVPTPTPEPGTLLLFTTWAMGVLARRRKK